MKTAKKLGITRAERKYLIKAARLLSTMRKDQKVTIPGDGVFKFDMRYITSPIGNHWEKACDIPGTYECGTAGCMAGLMHIMSHVDGSPVWDGRQCPLFVSPALYPLFYPEFYPDMVFYDDVTPKVAARAALRFLETGEVVWRYRKRR